MEERNDLIKELFELHKLLADKGEIGIGYGFSENYNRLEKQVKKLTLTDVVDSKRFTDTDLLNGYIAGCIEQLDDCCDLGLDDLKEIKEDGEKWVKRYTE